MITQGFRGTVRIYDQTSVDFYFRVSNIDIAVKREAQPFLPAYGGQDLKRIWHTGTGDITINFNAPVVEGLFGKMYDVAVIPKELNIDITYYGGEGRKATGCVVNTFSVTCNAGEVATMNMSFIAKSVTPLSVGDRTYTKGQKLLTWDKCNVVIDREEYLSQFVQSFSYNINNDIKSIKTSGSLFPSILAEGIQDISGQIILYDIVFPVPGAQAYALGFEDVSFFVDDITLTHEVVFNPDQNIPLSSGLIVSTLTWIKSNVGVTKKVDQ